MPNIPPRSKVWLAGVSVLVLSIVGYMCVRSPSLQITHMPLQSSRNVQSTSLSDLNLGNLGPQSASVDSSSSVGGTQQGQGSLWLNTTTLNETSLADVPTAAPSESPAPSPAPSDFPTFEPTGTPNPTVPPTAVPTESPAPSPAPSGMPSDFPTQTPSKGPTMEPTTTPYPTGEPSAAPSGTPTLVPSVSPTPAPTVSSKPSTMPSWQPSNLPTLAPSFQPSASPTFVGTQKTFFQVQFPLTELLTETQLDAFVQGTEEWIPQANVGEDSALTQAVVEVQKQSLEAAGDERRRVHHRQRRILQATDTSTGDDSSSTLVTIQFQVTVVYKGSDKEFNLYLALNPLFQLPDPLWIHMLGNYNDVYLQLRPESTIPPALVSNGNGSNMVNLSPAGTAVIAIVITGAVILGAAAVTVGVREYQLAMRGEEFHSPQGESAEQMFFQEGDEVQSMLPLPIQPYSAEPDGIGQNENVADDHQQYQPRASSQPDPVMYYEASNENDNPSAARGPRNDSLGDIFRGQSVYGRTGFDPPTAKSEVDASAAGSYSQRRALAEDNSRRSLGSAASSYQPSYREQSHEIMLTKSMGGTLGAAEFPTSPSEYTASQISSYYTNSMAGGPRQPAPYSGSGTLGARPLAHEQSPRQSIRSNPSFDSSVVPRAGLYDVFAPAGPIGIIVDTTKDGPAVHSLKASSPMRGLINPGDLIVALDDKDTRGMTAATLTRLMAKKAHQKERKITLLATDQY